MSYRRSAIKSIQYSSVTLGTVASNIAPLLTTVDRDYSVVVTMGSTTVSGNIGADRNSSRVELTDDATVTGYVNTVDAPDKVHYFMVLEFFPFSLLQPVQHLRLTTDTQLITTVGAKAAIFHGGFTTADATTQGQGWLAGATLTNVTTVTRIGPRSPTVACAVVDFK